MAPFADRAPPVTLRRAATYGRPGVECEPAPTWPEGAKGRQRAPRRVTFPWRPASCGRMQRRPRISGSVARRSYRDGGQARPGALRAPLKDLHVPARDAQAILGHTRVSTTLEIYTNVDEQARREALTRLHGLLDEGQG
jgi:hypothetical protein